MPAGTETTKRHRPTSLNLKASNHNLGDGCKSMNEYAMKCVSPGLPPLSAKMKSTFNISKSIEEQQRQIIASRKSMSKSENEEADDEDIISEGSGAPQEDKPPQTSTSQSSRTFESGVDISIPSDTSSKRLKRDRAPPPLNLNLNQRPMGPIIKSAPIYNINPQYQNTPVSSRRNQYKRRFQQQHLGSAITGHYPQGVVMTPNGPMRVVGNPICESQPNFTRRQQVTYPNVLRQFHSGGPKTAISNFKRTGVPLTQHQLAKYQQQLTYNQEQWAKFKEYQESRKVSHVTDVFEGDATRLAPVTSQPLSAQTAFFKLDTAPQASGPTPNSKENKFKREDDSGDEDAPERNAIEEIAVSDVDMEHHDATSLVRVQLRIMDSVFRFELDQSSADQDKKERFLNHCAAAWDQLLKQ